MNLFSAAGIELGEGGRSGGKAARVSARSRRVPLFNEKVLEAARQRAAFDPTEAQRAAARNYAKLVRRTDFGSRKETTVRPIFFQEIFTNLLGYRALGPGEGHTLSYEHPIRGGLADGALGRFSGSDGRDEIHAPFEVKGPDTRDLDAIMPGRGRSPVQQAWDYAVDAPGARWVLVSNCVKLRLYAFGRGRDAYEEFDLAKLDEAEQHARLWLILSADRFLGGATAELLRETDDRYRVITEDLYGQYKDLRGRLIGFLVHASDGPRLPMPQAIELAQKLLDRILFMAFAQDRRAALLPAKLIERVAATHDPWDPKPIWRNFLNVFRLLHEKGSPAQDIWPYNGGLFAPDPLADEVILPDPLAADMAALGEWDYGSDVPVSVLGHIFEQSITDIERERAQILGLPEPKVAKRKRQGVVYTPDFVTRFLVEHTIGLSLSERSAALLAKHAAAGATPKNGDPIGWHDGEASERAYYREYLDVLRGFTVVDPACGSGAFLVAAFDFLAREYQRVVARLATLGDTVDFDPFDEIVKKNLYGVDVNAESVEITRLALWLRTARRHHRLQNLEATIQVGDSLVEDASFAERPFDWRACFPGVFADGGFDIVIGNPPYVRMELIKPIKPYLEEHYVVAADRADLYAYFFERGVKLLKPGGRLGYISSSTFFRTGSGENLRTFLGDGAAVEAVVDFGDLQLFEGVTTYPAIVTLKRTDGAGGDLAFLKLDELPDELEASFKERARPMPRARLASGAWRFEDEPLARLRDKIAAGRQTLGEVYGAPLYGIKTGLNEAFIIDTPTRDRLVAADPKSAELLKPFLRGEDIKRWRVEPEGLFLINIPKGKVKIDDYPAIRDWLLPFKPELEKRATKQEWFELQQAQVAYQPSFEAPKIIYQDISASNPFAFDKSGLYPANTCYFIGSGDTALLGFLNSRLSWFFFSATTNVARGGYLRLRSDFVEQLSLPETLGSAWASLATLAEACTGNATHRFAVETSVRRRMLDLVRASAAGVVLSRKLENWWNLDFAAFRAEVKRVFRTEIPVKERGDWEAYLAENAAEVRRLTASIAQAEREIDQVVYRLFELTADEVRLLEASLEGQY